MKSNIFSSQHRYLPKVVVLLCITSMVLAACKGGPAPTPTNTATTAPVSTQVEETATPEEATLEPTATQEATLEEVPTEAIPEDLPTEENADLTSTEDAYFIETVDADAMATEDALFAEQPADETADAQGTEDLTTEDLPTSTVRPLSSLARTATKLASGARTTPIPGSKSATPGTATGGTRRSATPQSFEDTPSPDETPTISFNPTPVGVPLGNPSNPIIYGIVANLETADPALIDAAQQLAAQLSETTGLAIQVQTVNTTTELLNGMQLGAIHMAWLQPFSYILASRRDYAKVALVTNHYGVYAYGAQFLVNADSGLQSYYDSTTNKTSGDATTALAQLAGKRPCYVDPLSASGYIAPAGLLAEQKIQTGPPIYLLSHTAVIRALYVGGICDFGTTFAVYGDPRTSSSVQSDLSDVMSKVIVLWQTGEVIPNLNLSFQPGVPDSVSKKISSALMDMVLGEDGRQLISDANGYEIQDLKEVDDSFYDPLRDMVVASRVNLKTLIGK